MLLESATVQKHRQNQEEKWWRRGESEYSRVLKRRKLLVFRHAKNAEHGKIAPSWNVSGMRDFFIFRARAWLAQESNAYECLAGQCNGSLNHVQPRSRPRFAHPLSQQVDLKQSLRRYDFTFSFLLRPPLFPVHRCIAVFLPSNCSCFSMPFASK